MICNMINGVILLLSAGYLPGWCAQWGGGADLLWCPAGRGDLEWKQTGPAEVCCPRGRRPPAGGVQGAAHTRPGQPGGPPAQRTTGGRPLVQGGAIEALQGFLHTINELLAACTLTACCMSVEAMHCELSRDLYLPIGRSLLK